MELNRPLLNYSGGLLTKKLFGRTDLQTHFTGASILKNFLISVQGPMSFRPGSRFVVPTRGNGLTHLIPFIFNEEQAYALAFSHEKLRFFSDGGIITKPEIAITGITQADPGVITSAGHGLDNGDQIFIWDVVGMTELNGLTFLVANKDANTFTLQDLDGGDIETSNFGAYSSGGVFEKIYEIDVPFDKEDLEGIRVAQKADLMYVNHREYNMFKLRRFGENDWRFETYTRTSDPFTKAITAATKADPCVVTAVGHGLVTGDYIEINGVVGMTELNGNVYQITRTGADTFSLDGVNSTGYGVYTSGGYLFKVGNMPGALAFSGGRMLYGGTDDDPETFWGSRAPTDAGASRFDDFTVGSVEDDAFVFPIASQNNTADRIFWFAANHKFLSIGTLGGVYKAFGEVETAPITGVAINVRPVDFFGSAPTVPERIGTSLYYVQRGGLILNKFTFDVFSDGFVSDDINILSDELTKTGIKQLAPQQGAVAILWAIRNDGKLFGLSIKEQEKIMSWHEHPLGGTDAKVLSICGEPQPNKLDNLWMVVERTINGITRRYMEYLASEEPVPEFEDYFTGDLEADENIYRKIQWEFAKRMLRVDSALIYDATQNAALQLSGVSGEGLVFTAGSAVFLGTDVGRRIIKKYITGKESGIAEITAVNSATEAICKTLVDFDSTVDTSNLLTNSGFERWSLGDAAAPTGWTLTGANATVAKESTIVSSGRYSVKLTRVNADCSIYQAIHAAKGIAYWKGREITVTCRVYASVAGRVRLAISDGVGTTYSDYHTDDSAWETLTVIRTINASATYVRVSCGIDTGNTVAYFDDISCVDDDEQPIPADKWYLSITELAGLNHLEGETVTIVADGAVHPKRTVVDGKITLDDPSTIVQVGLKYRGWYRSMPLEVGGIRDASQTRTTILNKVGILFRHSLGVKYGTDVYDLEEILFRTTNDYTDSPPLLFSGARVLEVEDNYEEQKFINIVQDNPLPCTIQAIVPFVDTTNE